MIDTAAIRAAHCDDKSRQGTHWDTCENAHRLCAIAKLCDEVDRLREWVERLRFESDGQVQELHRQGNEIDELRDEVTRLRAGA